MARFDEANGVDGVFVYLTSGEMARYLGNSVNGLDGLFRLNVGAELLVDATYLDQRSATLRGRAGGRLSQPDIVLAQPKRGSPA